MSQSKHRQSIAAYKAKKPDASISEISYMVDVRDIVKHLDTFEPNWFCLSANKTLTWKILTEYVDADPIERIPKIDWYDILKNRNITKSYVKSRPDLPWPYHNSSLIDAYYAEIARNFKASHDMLCGWCYCWDVLAKHPLYSKENVIKLLKKYGHVMDWYLLDDPEIIDINVVAENVNQNWNWNALTAMLPLDDILRNQHLPPDNRSWSLYELTKRFNAEFIMGHPDGPFEHNTEGWDSCTVRNRDDISDEFKDRYEQCINCSTCHEIFKQQEDNKKIR